MVCILEEDPFNFQDALSSFDANFWKEAINDEMNSLESNETWLLVDLHLGWKQSVVFEWYVIHMRSILLYLNNTRYKIEHPSDAYLATSGYTLSITRGVVCWNKWYRLSPLWKVSGMRTLEKTNKEASR